MAIMSYDEWKRRTKLTMKPRSKALKFLDACLKEYDKNRGSRPYFDALVVGFTGWIATKADFEGSERNHSGAVTDLYNQIIEFRNQHMPHAHRGGTKLRSNALMREIKEGAKKMTEGKLKPQISVNIPLGEKDTGKGTVIWEEFEPADMPKARKGWADAYESARLAVDGINKIKTNAKEEQRFQRWFGTPKPAALNTVKSGLLQLFNAFQQNPVTIVNRPDITIHMVNGNDPFGEMKDGFSGSDVYGYVFHHKAGSGYRIVMGQWFLADPDPIEGAAQTIYHELTHKVLKTVDHAYGKIKCRGFAATDQQKALTNADNWAFYAVSFLKEI